MERQRHTAMIDFIKRLTIALLLAVLALPVAAAGRDRDHEEKEHQERAEARSSINESRERRALERELRAAQRAFQAAARRVQELKARLVAEQAEARAAREQAILSTIHIRSRARLGVVVDPSLAEHHGEPGAEIMAVTPGSPAEAAGLQPGDVIVTMNGQVLAGDDPRHREENAAAELIRRARSLEPGDEVTLTIRRDDTSLQVVLEAEEAGWAPLWVTQQIELPSLSTEYWPYALLEYESPDEETLKKWMDFELVALTPELGKYFGSDKGVLVIRAPEDPPLDVKVGDVIMRIGGEALATPLEAVRTLRSIEPGKKVDVKLLRERNELTVQAVVPVLRTLQPRRPEKKDD